MIALTQFMGNPAILTDSGVIPFSEADIPRLIAELTALLPTPTVHRVVIEGRPLSWNILYASPNRFKRAKIAEEYHALTVIAVREQLPDVVIKTPVRIAVIAYGKGQIMDADNVCAKVFIDGLVQAGLIPDDDPAHVQEVRLVSRKDNVNPRVEISIEEGN